MRIRSIKNQLQEGKDSATRGAPTLNLPVVVHVHAPAVRGTYYLRTVMHCRLRSASLAVSLLAQDSYNLIYHTPQVSLAAGASAKVSGVTILDIGLGRIVLRALRNHC